MTKEEYENLKVGDLLNFNDVDDTLHLKVLEKRENFIFLLVEVIKSTDKHVTPHSTFVIQKKGLKYYSINNKKPKKLYKPWG